MPKCLECGFEAPRLQWTHFKFNCSGKFNNSKEYRKVYLNAPLVDSELAKKTAVTKENLVKKYGKHEGQNRWIEYKNKQAQSNSFEYKEKKHGWTREQYDGFNKSRSQTLENMISKYGEEAGALKWKYYCDRQAYTNTKKYFIEKYGFIEGEKKFKEVCKKKSRTTDPKYIASEMNITLDEAVEVIINRQTRSGKTWGSESEEKFTKLLENKLKIKLEYTTFTKPFGKWSKYLNSYVIYDIKHDDFIIEFNGDYWHANPEIYKDTAKIRGNTAVDIQKRDMLKLQTVKDLGFRTYTVWESNFNSDPEKTIGEVIGWIRNGQK